VGDLAAAFDEMRLSLKEYIRNLRETTAAQERLESELLIARNIQMSFIPKRSPRLLAGSGLEIYGTLEPAQEVGGDLYSFFPVDDEHLFFAVGDVSGKGIPAALFMAVTITLMKGIARRSADPADILEQINAELCDENDSLLFVTVFCGILNIRSGELRYSNAGHNPPVLRPRGESARWLKVPEGFLLGVDEMASYRTESINLSPGDEIVLYTDGVTEAMNPEKCFFSVQRSSEPWMRKRIRTRRDWFSALSARCGRLPGQNPSRTTSRSWRSAGRVRPPPMAEQPQTAIPAEGNERIRDFGSALVYPGNFASRSRAPINPRKALQASSVTSRTRSAAAIPGESNDMNQAIGGSARESAPNRAPTAIFFLRRGVPTR
jgi:hypothetical protein